MPGLSALDLLFDARLEAAIRAQWDALAGAGLSSLAAHTAASNRPHITLVARGSFSPETLQAAVRMVTVPTAVTIGDPVLFGTGDRRVLVREVRLDERIVAAQAVLDAALPVDDVPLGAPGASSPERWVPHVTLARRMRVDALDRALALIEGGTAGQAEAALHGHVVALRLWNASTTTVTVLAGRDTGDPRAATGD